MKEWEKEGDRKWELN
jgi:hypothetical protein